MYHLAYGRRTATLALLAYAMLIVSLDQYIVVVALPEIGQDLGFSEQTLQAVISPYAVASAGFLMLGGRAADVLGRRRILVTGLALYASASLAGGLAPAPGFLLIARATQGFGGALVFPPRSRSSTPHSPRAASGTARRGLGPAGAAGLVVGVLLGGVLTQALGWEAVFFVNVPLAAGAVLLAFSLIPADPDREIRRLTQCTERDHRHHPARVRARSRTAAQLGFAGHSGQRGRKPIAGGGSRDHRAAQF
jgi:MFS family permease